MFDEKNIPYLPYELVDIIADFVDYEKYSKPKHYELLKDVINDIGIMASIMPTIIPNLVWKCWGPGRKYLLNIDYEEIIVTLPLRGVGYL